MSISTLNPLALNDRVNQIKENNWDVETFDFL